MDNRHRNSDLVECGVDEYAQPTLQPVSENPVSENSDPSPPEDSELPTE